jgi:hypothetical protein
VNSSAGLEKYPGAPRCSARGALLREMALRGSAQKSCRTGETASAMGRTPGGRRGSRGGLRLLQLAAFFSSFDRFVVGQMLVTIAATAFGASLAETTATASLYYLLYGGCSPCGGCSRSGSGGCA